MNPEERDDGFLKDKDEADLDIPTARRKGYLQRKNEADEEGGDEERVGASRGYFVRRTLRERELEEERQHWQAVYKPRKGVSPDDEADDDEEEYDDYEDAGRTKAPKLVRVFAWVALLAVFFAGGYVGANYFFSKADKKGARIGNVVSGGSEVRAGSGVPSPTGLGDVNYTLFMPQADGSFEQRSIKIRRGLPEEDIRHLLTVYIDGLKEIMEFEPGARVLNIYRSGDWLYIDMSQDFLKSLKALGKEKSTLALTGLVQMMQVNFPPVKKVKFYIEGKESKDKVPVDIENAWELKR